MAGSERSTGDLPFLGQPRPGGDSFNEGSIREHFQKMAMKNDSSNETPEDWDKGLREPTLQHPLVAINVRFPSASSGSTETSLADTLELQNRWKGILSRPPEKSLAAHIFTFNQNVARYAVAAVIPGMVEFRIRGNVNQAFTQIGEAVLTKNAVLPEAYSITISGIRPQAEDELITHVVNSMEQALDQKALINMKRILGGIGLDLLGIGQKLYMNSSGNYYIVDIGPDMNNPYQLTVEQRSNRISPVTLDRVQKTLEQDLSFFDQTVVGDVVQRLMEQKVA